ncbi:MAG: hypothetical protein U0228_07275 [Myxococcaceae bacterium]
MLTALTLTLLLAPPGPEPPPAPPLISPPVFRAEVVKPGAAPTLIDEGATSAVSGPEGRAVAWLARGQLQVLDLGRGATKPKTLGPAAGWLKPSPDGRFVVSPGSPLQRDGLETKDGRITLAKGEALHQLTGLAIGRTHFGFISGAGRVVVASLDEGVARSLVVDAPKDARCHMGDGFPRDFTADGQWLMFQSGCDAHGAAKVDGSALVKLDFDSAKVVGQHVVGSKSNGPIQVAALDTQERWTIPNSSLAPFPFVYPLEGRAAFVQANHDGLEFVDLREKTVRMVLPAGEVGPVSSFLSPASDGQRVLAIRQGATACELHLVDLRPGAKSSTLARLDGVTMCEARWAGPKRAVLYGWGGASSVLADIDLQTLVLRTHGGLLGPPGNVMASTKGALVVSGGRVLFVPLD